MTDHAYTPHRETLAALMRGATQIRIPLDPQPESFAGFSPDPHGPARVMEIDGKGMAVFRSRGGLRLDVPLPYAEGDMLWVREWWGVGAFWDQHTADEIPPEARVYYREDVKNISYRARPASKMPRWASRLHYRITGVRVERVQETEAGDVIRMGIPEGKRPLYRWWLARFWDAIHGDGAWDRNDWVAVYDLERVE